VRLHGHSGGHCRVGMQEPAPYLVHVYASGFCKVGVEMMKKKDKKTIKQITEKFKQSIRLKKATRPPTCAMPVK